MSFRRSILRSVFALATLVAFGAAHADPRVEIEASYAHMVKAGKFRVKTTTVAGGQTHASESTVQWPDRFHIRNEGGEFIVIPGKTYMKQGGSWMPFPMDMSAMIQAMTPDAQKKGYANMTNVKALPDEDVGGVAASVYEYDTSATVMGITAQSHVTVWLAKDDGRILKQRAAGTAMGQASVTDSLYEFDPAIEIKPPM